MTRMVALLEEFLRWPCELTFAPLRDEDRRRRGLGIPGLEMDWS